MLTLPDLLLGALPALLWLSWFWFKDRHEREPHANVLTVFALGALGALLIASARPRLESFVPTRWIWDERVVDAYLVTALPEECVKLGAFLCGGLWLRECDEPMDGIVYAAAAALGFASLENAYYLACEPQRELVVVRAFTATLAHVEFTALAGFALTCAKLGRGRWRRVVAALGVLAAVLAHGTYDWILAGGPERARWPLFAFLLVSLGLLAGLMRWSLVNSPHAPPLRNAS